MSERTHSRPEGTHAVSAKRKVALLLAGTAVALLIAGGLFQIFRAEPADAGAEQPGSQGAGGTARVRAPVGQPKDLARVNDQVVSWELVAQECMARHGSEVLDSIINRVIIQQACDNQGLVVTEDEVNNEIIKISQRFSLTPDDWYKMLQAERNITPQQYRRDIIWPMLALKELAGNTVNVTDEDMQKAYIREYGEKVMAKMIMFDKIDQARTIWEQARKDLTVEKFEQLAQEHSVEPNSRALSGAIPPIRQYSGGSEKLEEEAFKLKPGQMSGVIEVGLGRYVILYCEGRTKTVAKMEEVYEPLREHVVEAKVQEAVAQVFSKLKEDAVVHNFLTNTTTGGIKKASATQPGIDSIGQPRPGSASPNGRDSPTGGLAGTTGISGGTGGMSSFPAPSSRQRTTN